MDKTELSRLFADLSAQERAVEYTADQHSWRHEESLRLAKLQAEMVEQAKTWAARWRAAEEGLERAREKLELALREMGVN